MRTRLRSRRLVMPAAAILLALLLALPAGVLAVNLSLNGGFETFQAFMENGQPRFWQGFPEWQARNWLIQVMSGADRLHFMDSSSFGEFLAAKYGVSYSNYRLEGNRAQAFASQYGFSFVFSQTVTVESGVDYALGGKIVTFWKGPGPEMDDGKIFKRIGIDPTGGHDPNAAGVVWSEWDGHDNEWRSPALAVTAQATRATLFIQVENRGDNVGTAYLNAGYLDSFHFNKAPVTTLDLPAQAAAGPLEVTWSAAIPDPNTWSLWGYDVEYREGASGSSRAIQTVADAGRRAQAFTLSAGTGVTYTVRVRAWQQKQPAGDATIPALPGMWVEKQVQVTGDGGDSTPGNYTIYLPMVSQVSAPPPEPSPTPDPDPSPEPSPTPEPSPSSNEFRLANVSMLSITENGGCPGNHNVFMSVIDSAGEPLFGPVIGDPPANNFRVTSGDKNEPFFSYGTKTAEITLFSNGTRLKVIENPSGTPATSEQTPLLSTNTWEIPVDWLVEAGYCDSPANCGGLLCQGHYSYWVVFQRKQGVGSTM